MNCESCGMPVVTVGSVTEDAAGNVVLMKCKECYEQSICISLKKIVLPHDCSRPAGPEPTREEVDRMDLGRQLAWHRYWNANK